MRFGRAKKAEIKSLDVRFQRSGFDRRTGDDRRQAYSVDYFDNGGVERRRKERRVNGEKRSGWQRITNWSSVYIGKLNRNVRYQ